MEYIVIVVALILLIDAQSRSYQAGVRKGLEDLARSMDKAYRQGRRDGLKEREIALDDQRKFIEALERLKKSG